MVVGDYVRYAQHSSHGLEQGERLHIQMLTSRTVARCVALNGDRYWCALSKLRTETKEEAAEALIQGEW